MKVFNLPCDFEIKEHTFTLSSEPQLFNVDFGIITEREKAADYYEGPYTVTPRIYEQELEIAEKKARQDISIKKIPTYEVDNTKGTTFYIGDKLNGN